MQLDYDMLQHRIALVEAKELRVKTDEYIRQARINHYRKMQRRRKLRSNILTALLVVTVGLAGGVATAGIIDAMEKIDHVGR